MTLQYGCSPINFLYIFRIPFSKKTSGGLLLKYSVIDVCQGLKYVTDLCLKYLIK